MKRFVTGLAAVALFLTGGGARANFIGVDGGQLFSTGGDITITVLANTAAFTNNLNLYLFFPSTSSPLFIAQNHNLGATVNLTGSFLSSQGIEAGDELVFGIFVVNTGNTFFMGPSSRNPDGLIHNRLNVVSPGSPFVADVGFEDLFGPPPFSDRNFNDTVFRFQGALAVQPVPEPATLVSLGTGALCLMGYARRRRRAAGTDR
jgi:hypothetical protein